MGDIQYNLQFDKLVSNLQLGSIVGEPEEISGGLLHRMYAIQTTEGKYAVKALNPSIMLRSAAMQNYIDSEQVASMAANRIPAIPAKRFSGVFIHEIDGQFYLVFDWVEGKSLKPDEIRIIHCEKIGAILAKLHMKDFSKHNIIKECSVNIQLIDWNYYLQKGQEAEAIWVDMLLEVIDNLYDWTDKTNIAEKELSEVMVVGHRDMDTKNVLWNGGNPFIIDWESAGYINPMVELVETAVYWSEYENGEIDKERFLAFMNSYKKTYGPIQVNWRMVLLSGFVGKLGWLQYNLKRSLRIECTDDKEQQLGTDQVIGTIGAIESYSNVIPKLEKWLKEEIDT